MLNEKVCQSDPQPKNLGHLGHQFCGDEMKAARAGI